MGGGRDSESSCIVSFRTHNHHCRRALFRQSDDSHEVLKDLGTQLLLSGKYGSVADFAKSIDGVTQEQLTSAARKLLSSRPTLAAYDDTHTVPHYSAIEAALK